MRKLSASLVTASLTATFVIFPVVGSSAEPPAAQTSEQSVAVDGVSSKALKDDTALEAAPAPSNADAVAPGSAQDQLNLQTQPGDSSEIVDEDQLAALSAQKTTKPFNLAGITWDSNSPEEIISADARVRENGEWTQWNSLELLPTENGDATAGTEPLIADEATGIQVRVLTVSGTEPDGLEVTLIDAGDSKNDDVDAADPIASSASADTSSVLKPNVVPREQWMGSGDKKYTTWKSDYSARLDAMYIHHTAGSNSYSSTDGAKIVRSIYLYHAKTLGWGDIGYQFLVDKFGNIFEGRYDSIEALPVGAQTGGYNSGTIGISSLGNYETAEPTTAQINAIVSVLSWKAYQYGLDPLGKVKLLTGTSSKSSLRAAQGTYVTVPTILAHRDTNYTACPGKYLYAKMSEIRKKVAAKVTAATDTYGSYVAPLKTPVISAIPGDVYPTLLDSTVTFSWSAVPNATSYQILTRASNTGSALGRDITWTLHKTVTTNSVKLTFNAGQSRYIAVRAVSATGHSFPVKITQITRAVAATTATASSGWTTLKSTDQYSGAAKRTAKSGQTLTFGTASAIRRVSVVGDTGPTAGTVEVLVGGVVRGSVSFKASTSRHNSVKTVDLGVVRSGTVKLRTVGENNVWVISGVGLLPEEQGDAHVPETKSAQGLTAPAAPSAIALTKSQAPVLLPTSLTYKWKAVNGAVGYEVAVRRAAYNATMPSAKKVIGTVTGTSYTYKVSAGASAKLYVRAIGANGKKSAWSPYATVNRPPSAAKIIRSGTNAWSKPKSSKYFRGYVLYNNKKGQKLSIANVKSIKKIALTVAAQPGSGRLQVFVGGKKVSTVSLAAKTVNHQARITVTLPSTMSGRVTLKTVDNKPVRVSAVTLIR